LRGLCCSVLPGLGDREPPPPMTDDRRVLMVPSHRLRVLALLWLRRELLRTESELMGMPRPSTLPTLPAALAEKYGGGVGGGASTRSSMLVRQIGHCST